MMLRPEPNKNEALINYEGIVFGKILGTGGFGEVYHGTWRHNDVAIKKLLMKKITAESAQEFEAESQIMARLRSPNIVQFYGYSIEPERCIVMEYCPNGSLFSVLQSDKPLEWSIRVNIALGAAKGLAFLHEERILHRDIKSLNILLTAHFEAKLTDFGLSKLKAETKSHSAATKSNSAIGTLQWMAPELFDPDGVYTGKSDIYSLGVTFWELASRKIPFEKAVNPMLVPMWIGQGKRETIPSDCPSAFGTLIQQCWAGDPSARPDTNTIITQLKNSLEAFSASKISKAPSPNPSPLPASSGPQYLSNLVSEEAPKLSVFSPSAKLQPAPQIKQASPEAVAAFVRLIAEGEQDEVEALLQKDRTLALLASDVTDLSARTFKGITGFQYAVWALDWHMWTMIRKYLPNDDARAQLQAMASASWVKQHGQSASWQNLLDAQRKVIDLCRKSQYDAATICWQREVGGAQRLLPVHVVNEYCHPTRPFDPCPDFTKAEPLPRTRKIDEGEWFTATYNGGKLGEKFGIYRGRGGVAGAEAHIPSMVLGAHHKACHTLLITRTQQLDLLLAELSIISQLKNSVEAFSAPKISNAPSPNPSSLPALSGPQYLSNLVSKEAPKPLVFSSPQPKQPVPIKTLRLQSNELLIKVSRMFLRQVAQGKQENAENTLQKLPMVALQYADVTDLSGRIFKGITGFQYAVWALDWHMWTMILKYLPKDVAAEQIKAMDKGPWLSQHRKSGDWLIQNLLDALQTYINLCNQSKWPEVSSQWQTKVGSSQRLLPVHVINEYCHPNHPFDPCPDFRKPDPLPRTQKINEGEWFIATYNGGKLGEKFGLYRGRQPAVCGGWGDGNVAAPHADYTACRTLLVTRAQQREQLIAELSTQLKKSVEAFPAPEMSAAFRPNSSPLPYLNNLISEEAPKPLVFSPPKSPAHINTPRPAGLQITKESLKDLLLNTLSGHAAPVLCLQLLPSGELVSASWDKTLKVWDLRMGKCLKTLEGDSSYVKCLQPLPSGELVSGSEDSTLKVWDLRTGTFKTLKGHTAGVSCLQLLSSSELVSGSHDNTLKVWDLKTGKCIKTLAGHAKGVTCLQLLPSGELVSGSYDNTLKVWDLRTGICLKTLAGHTGWVICLQLLPSGELVSGSDDNTLKVWNLRAGTCLKTLEGHADVINCLQPLLSGGVVSGSRDSTLKIWDLRTGTCLKTLEGHAEGVSCLQVLPSGELVSGSWDKTLKIWDLTEFNLAPVIEEKKAQRLRK